MPSKKRIKVLCAIAHIMARGIDGLNIFLDDEDRVFLKQLRVSLEKWEYHGRYGHWKKCLPELRQNTNYHRRACYKEAEILKSLKAGRNFLTYAARYWGI